MGIEPCPKTSQVFESTHRSSSVWVHLGAKFCVWTKQFTYLVDCFVLCVADHMSINLQRSARVRVPHLLLRDLRICAYIDEKARMTVSKRVHAGPRDPQGIEHWPEAELNNLVCRARVPFSVYEQKSVRTWFPRCQVFPQHFRENLRHCDRCPAGFSL